MELPELLKLPVLRLSDISHLSKSIFEVDFLSVGGGIGSFTWVDTLRVHGVAAEKIAVISRHDDCYAQFKQYCDNSHLSGENRLRSDSGSRPDNFWGFPGYALSEFLLNIRAGKIISGLKILGQIVLEPIFSDYYTPRTIDVFASLSREQKRIGWSSILKKGDATILRKTTDGRFVVFYEDVRTQELYAVVARSVHFALGHTLKSAIEVEPDKSGTFPTSRIRSIYTENTQIVQNLIDNGGTVAVIGRGIAASRAIEKLLSESKKPEALRVVSLFRGVAQSGARSFLGWKLQSFNWPRGSFGGKHKEEYHGADIYRRRDLAADWGAPTTPPRAHWLHLVRRAHSQERYSVFYGDIISVTESDSRVTICTTRDVFEFDYVLDCTGFNDNVASLPIYGDMISHYALQTNKAGGFVLSTAFEIEGLNSEHGCVFVSGVGSMSNHYGPVDSFSGHQFAAHQMIARISTLSWSRVRLLNPVASCVGWYRWMRGSI